MSTKPAATLRDEISHIAWSLKQEGFQDSEIASAMLEVAVNLSIINSNYTYSANWLRTTADFIESQGSKSN
ncbi:MAG: hypothetical protein N0E58_19435 [Candidatus Thiodiazotropha endolucinida]|uniref:Uncharacterized protein n=1 Tax=Candidatus Thiodiazotropha taylori TaxID=2792791 RepID=A0A9E4TUD3_9GAMM|nr:hypothetical protein [Candidatus Thiodiazotropha taylori]MCW4238424.1 hypothetical protein [Candidatus Thiodiazotropha endolucinida]